MNEAKNLRVDPDVKVPAAVRAAAARSEEIHRSIYNPDQPAAGEDTAKASGEDQATPDQQIKPAQQTAQAQQPAQQPAQAQPADENWQHRYNSMRGRYDAASQALSQRDERIAQLENIIASLSQPEELSPELQASRLLTQDEREAYGDEMLEVVGKRAREEFDGEVRKLKSEIATLQQQVGNVSGTVAHNTRANTFSYVREQVPNFDDLNKDPNFISWLGLRDTYTGAKRQELLNDAVQRNDGPRIAAFFKGFLAEQATTAPVNPEPVTQEGKVPLETFAAPGRAKSAATHQVPAEKPTITRPEIEAFYRAVNRGVYANDPNEKNRIERLISDAAREGRVR